MTVLVTGGAGFIGSALVRASLERGEEVRVLDDLSTGKRSNLEGLAREIEFVEGDIRNLDLLRRVSKGVDVVFHQGALGSVARSVDDPLTSHEVNATGTLNVLVAARDCGVRRVVFASSSSVYGSNPNLPKQEDMVPMPISPYAVSKMTGEYYCRQFHGLYGLAAISLRYFNVFGPRQDPESVYAAVIPRFIKALHTGKRPVIYGDGKQTRDFTYIDNVVQANLKAAYTEGLTGEYFNVAVHQRISLLDLLEELGKISGRTAEPEFHPARAGDVRDSLASIEKAQKLLGYKPTVELADGLRKTYEWFTQQA